MNCDLRYEIFELIDEKIWDLIWDTLFDNAFDQIDNFTWSKLYHHIDNKVHFCIGDCIKNQHISSKIQDYEF